MNLKHKKIGAICGICALALVAVASFAYFTDRAELTANGTAGTVDLELTNNINLLDEDGQDILNPGDKRTVEFIAENKGNKSIDVRTTIVLTSDVAMTGSATTQSEYDLYKRTDVELKEGYGYVPKAGATPIEVKSISDNGMKITYDIPDYILSGDTALPEYEKEFVEETGDDLGSIYEVDDSYTYDYVLVFKGDAGNNFQGSKVKIDVLVEAKQHRNTSAGWEIIAQETYGGSGNFDAGTSVVPGLENTTSSEYAYSVSVNLDDYGTMIPFTSFEVTTTPENVYNEIATRFADYEISSVESNGTTYSAGEAIPGTENGNTTITVTIKEKTEIL